MSIHVMSLVWKKSKQQGGDLLLLLALADYANDDGYCWPSVKSLADRGRMTDRNVRKILRKLEEDGEIATQPGAGMNGTNRYRVMPPSEDYVDELFDFCALCDRPGSETNRIEGHHILPRSKGGGELRANKIPVCASCHRRLHEPKTHELSDLGKLLLRDGKTAARDCLRVQGVIKTGGQFESFSPVTEDSQTVKEPSSKTKGETVEEVFKSWEHGHKANPVFIERWTTWVAARKTRKKPISAVASKRQLELLGCFTVEQAIESIDASIRNDWTGLFPPRGTSGSGKERKATFA